MWVSVASHSHARLAAMASSAAPAPAVATAASSDQTRGGHTMVKRWQASRGPPFAIFAIVWAAFVVQWLVVVDGMVYEPASSKLAWRAAVIALPCAVTLALWCVHFLDPGVIPPKQETDPEVAWYLAQRRPVALGARFADADGVRRAVRFSKDFRGQTVKTILPEALLHPEDPEGPVLADGSAPEFSAACWTVRHCKTCRVWRPPKASHCAVCGHCMARFDHHCPVVGACIAQRNTRWFIALLITGGLACGAYFGGAVVRAAQVCDADTGVGRGKCHGTWEVIVLGIYAALLLYGALALLGAGAAYASSVLADVTTKERLGKKPPGFEAGMGAEAKHWSAKTAFASTGRGANAGGARAWAAAGAGACGETCFAPVRIRPNHPPTWLEPEQVEM